MRSNEHVCRRTGEQPGPATNEAVVALDCAQLRFLTHTSSFACVSDSMPQMRQLTLTRGCDDASG